MTLKTTAVISNKDNKYILLFYCVMVVFNRIIVWFGYGGFQSYNQGYNNILDVTEFFAASGFDDILKFIFSVPLIYFIVNKVSTKSIFIQSFVFLTYGIVFVYVVVNTSTFLKSNLFGWVDFFADKNRIWLYYHSTFFYLVQLGLLLTLIYTRKYKITLREKFELNQVLLENQLSVLKSQLNPHFIHNTFNSINAAIEPQNEKARELIIALSDLFRYQNEVFQKDYVTIEEEINFIKKYLSILQVRFKERLQVFYDIEEDILQEKIPSMLLQPIVENAIQHGVAPKVEVSSLTISMKKVNEKIEFIIADTGSGISDKSKMFDKGLGLKNTKLRLEKLYQSTLFIEDNVPSGLKIHFRI